MPIWLSNPSAVTDLGTAMIPALFMQDVEVVELPGELLGALGDRRQGRQVEGDDLRLRSGGLRHHGLDAPSPPWSRCGTP